MYNYSQAFFSFLFFFFYKCSVTSHCIQNSNLHKMSAPNGQQEQKIASTQKQKAENDKAATTQNIVKHLDINNFNNKTTWWVVS